MSVRVAAALFGLLSLSATSQAAVPLVPAQEAGPDDLPIIETVRSDSEGAVFVFELRGLATEAFTISDESYLSVSIPGGGLEGGLGEPGIPTFSRFVQLPEGAAVTVTVEPEEIEEVSDVLLLPVQAEEGDGFAFDLASYSRQGYGDAPTAAIAADPTLMRNLRVVALTFRPVRYNPAERTLEVTRRMRVEVRFAGGGPLNAAPARMTDTPPSFDRIYRNLVLNYDGPVAGTEIQPGTWLVICPNDAGVVARLQPLVDWRQRKGLPVYVATTAETGSTANAIKAWIQNAYDNWPAPPEYIVLAGDADGSYAIPTFYENYTGYHGEGDHPYGQLAGGDILLDAHVGRLSFTSYTELEVIVNKMVGYESNPWIQNDPDWFQRACLVGDPSSSGYSTIQVQQWIKTRLRQLGFVDANIDTIFSGSFVSQMTSALNRGDTIFCYRGYLNMSGWGNTNTYALTNGWKMPYAVISTCGTGSFAGSTARSEAFLRANAGATNPKGAIGAVGTATIGTHTRFNNCLTMGMYQGMLYEGIWEMGPALTRGKYELYLNYPTDPNNVGAFSYWNNLMGDPAGEIWTDYPNPLTVGHPTTLSVGANALVVTVEDGDGPVEDARICAWKGAETYVVGLTGADGVCELPVNLPTSGTLRLTVTAHDRYPYTADISVGQQNVFVGYQASQVNDDDSGESQGNGDGQVNPGETIELRVQLKNFGTQTASGVVAALTSDDPYITIVDGSETYGNIAAGASVWSPDDFDFQVSPACPDGHTLRFSLDVTAGPDQWHSLIELAAVSADLVAEGINLHNAGGNGVFDPGEMVGLSVVLRNSGGAGASSISATLRSLSPWVSVIDSTANFGTIAPGATGENTLDPFDVTASSGTYEGHLAFFDLITTFNDGAVDTAVVSVTVGQRSSNDPVGPDAYGYYALDNTDTAYPEAPVYDWIEIDPSYGGAGTQVTLGDYGAYQDKSRTVPLPFTFQFYGEPFNEVTICSNGWLAMGSTYLTDYRNWSIPGAGSPNNLLAVFWDDLIEASGGKVVQWYDAANHRWIVEWSRMRSRYNSSVTETFEAILYDPAYFPTPSGDGPIVFQYNQVQQVDGTDGYSTVGIQNFDHTVGLLYTYFNRYSAGAATLAAGRAIRFLPVVAQPLGTIAGRVTNASWSDVPIEGAEVRLLESGRTFFTQEDGGYGGGVPEGIYTVTASHPSFEPDTVWSVQISQSQPAEVDFSLTDIAGPTITDVTDIGITSDSQGPYLIEATIVDFSTVAEAKLVSRTNLGPWLDQPMEEGRGLYQILLDGMPAGTRLDYYVEAQDGLGLVSTNPDDAPDSYYTAYVTEVAYLYEMEDPGDPDWQLGVPGDDATTGLWERADPVGTTYDEQPVQPEDDHTPAPGVKCFVTGASGGAAGDNDVDGGCTTLQSPAFDLSGVDICFASYWRWYAEGGLSSDDEFAVDVSSDGGSTWTPLERVPDNENFWSLHLFDLGAIIDLTDQVVFRFIACDLGTGGLVEAAIDDFTLEIFQTNTTGVDELGEVAIFRLEQNRPNPFSEGTAISFSLGRPGLARLEVYDVQGRTVRRLVEDHLGAGPHTVVWDGRDERGAPVSSGVYFYRLDADGRSTVRKILRLQ